MSKLKREDKMSKASKVRLSKEELDQLGIALGERGNEIVQGAVNPMTHVTTVPMKTLRLVVVECVEALITEREREARYCGICYKPSIENGGWWCPKHAYNSILITRSEASELRELKSKKGKK